MVINASSTGVDSTAADDKRITRSEGFYVNINWMSLLN